MLLPYAAGTFALLIVLVALFQGALAAGAPWGRLAWGGQHPGRLPDRLRRMSVVSALVLLLFGAVVLSHAGLALPGLRGFSRVAIWGVVAYCAVGALANAATRSRAERALWLPVVVLLLASSLAVALH